MTRPVVSVIIPTYNRALWLAESSDSVLAQDFAPFEVVVVDDGSKDNTAEVLAPFGDRVRVVRQANASFVARTATVTARRRQNIAVTIARAAELLRGRAVDVRTSDKRGCG